MDKAVLFGAGQTGRYIYEKIKGKFSKHINRCFSDRKLYLFDTFDGFSRKDIEVEQEYSLSKAVSHCFKNDDVDLYRLTYKGGGVLLYEDVDRQSDIDSRLLFFFYKME